MKIPKIFQERDPTRGSLVKTSLSYCYYLWLNTGFWIGANLLNLYWISKLGEEAIAAVGISGAAFAILMSITQGIGVATFNLVGSFDRKNQDELRKLVKQILSILFIASALLAISSYFLAPTFLRLLGDETNVLDLAISYFRICSLGGIASLCFWPLSKMIRSATDMFRAMLFVALVLAVQAVLDYLLILGNLGFPRMELMGAALSFIISDAMGLLAVVYMLAKGSMFVKIDFRKWSEFKVTTKVLKDIFRISTFDTIENLIRAFVIMIMFGIAASFGTMALAAFAIGQRFFKYSSQFAADVGETTAIVLANNRGAGDLKRAQKSGWVNSVIAVVLLVVIGVASFVLAEGIVRLFSQEEETLAAGAAYFKITTLAGIGYLFFAIGAVLRRAFGGAGDTLTPLWVYSAMAAIQIGLSAVLPMFLGLGINGVWIAILVGEIFYGSTLAIMFKRKGPR